MLKMSISYDLVTLLGLVVIAYQMASVHSYTLYDVFQQVTRESTNEKCKIVSGKIPTWLNGVFLRQTSGSWGTLSNTVPKRIENINDAVGMGSVFHITGRSQTVLYSNRYYRALPYQVWNYQGRSLNRTGAAFWTLYSQPSAGIDNSIKKYPDFLSYAPSHTFWKVGTNIEAVSDGSFGTIVNPITMDNDGKPFPYADTGLNFGLDGIMFNNAAHAAEDSTGILWSAVYNADKTTGKTKLIVYRIIPTGNTAARQMVAVKELPRFSIEEADCSTTSSASTEKLKQYRKADHLPGYIHDIAVTPNYIVLPISSMLVDYCFMFVYKYWAEYAYSPLYSFWFKWRPDKYSSIQLLNKETNRFYEVRIKPLFIAHIINAFEDQITGTIVLDVLTSNDGRHMTECTSISAILTNKGFSCPTRVERIIVDIPDSAASRYRLTQIEWNFFVKPRINPNFQGEYYTQTYMISKWLSPQQNAIVKLNTRSTETQKWIPDPNYLIDDLVFVPSPSSRDEEDGVLLVGGQNLRTNRGFVIVLDPNTLKRIAEIQAPSSTPPSGGHSKFYFFNDLKKPEPLLGSAERAGNFKTAIISIVVAIHSFI